MIPELDDVKYEGLDSRWFAGVEDKEKFKTQLFSQTILWKQLIRILKELYRNATTREYDLDKPNLHERMIFNEGYKQCLADMYKLIPTQKETIR